MGKWLPGISRRSRARVQRRVSRLGARIPGTAPRPEFRAELRERLMNAPREEAAPARTGPAAGSPAERVRPRGARLRLPSLLPRLLSLGLATAMVAAGLATYRSVPGDTLYPLKRAAENTMLRLSADDAERADRELSSASTRADEVEELLGSATRSDSRLVGETLKEMEDTTRSAVTALTRVRRDDAKVTSSLKRFVQKQRDQIEGMLPKMDEDAQRRANGYLNYIEGLAPPE
ncbi:DUF5667 domain-containing protein [Planomonospora venezuelensis]|uniref:Putative DNA-binding protein n=1 Tax=Planomonospora venezuelensis TaxID=1999 RepID=A0A841D0W8_PLAVE|nr:DUF5667 domain-containing protein [Planomonospora venezuelensis]MBB5961186.1 putative DNA-binding protein [Planomonospora venezuelensis]GIM99858.1 hypothetical protein Pve01_15170 [Planomonospora venezuelensis]